MRHLLLSSHRRPAALPDPGRETGGDAVSMRPVDGARLRLVAGDVALLYDAP